MESTVGLSWVLYHLLFGPQSLFSERWSLMLEERNRELLELPNRELGWLQMLGHRARVFGVLAASLSLDAVFMVFWLCVHVLFTFSTANIEKWLRGKLDFPEGQTTSLQPFRLVFFLSTSLLDLAAFAVMVYFIYWDVRTFWRKLSNYDSGLPARKND